MTSHWLEWQAGSETDRAEQHILVRDNDRDAGFDPTALSGPIETTRAAMDSAALTDRIDQAWVTPLDCDDDYDRGVLG